MILPSRLLKLAYANRYPFMTMTVSEYSFVTKYYESPGLGGASLDYNGPNSLETVLIGR